MVVRAGFEPAKLARQIYSLIPLATREPHQIGAHYRDYTQPCQPLFSYLLINKKIVFVSFLYYSVNAHYCHSLFSSINLINTFCFWPFFLFVIHSLVWLFSLP